MKERMKEMTERNKEGKKTHGNEEKREGRTCECVCVCEGEREREVEEECEREREREPTFCRILNF